MDDGGCHEGWIITVEKRYQGTFDLTCATILKKKPFWGVIPVVNKTCNQIVVSDCIIVEDGLGRVCGLWYWFYSKWRWSRTLYEDVFQIAVTVTIFHVPASLLQIMDSSHIKSVPRRVAAIGGDEVYLRRCKLSYYRGKRRICVHRQFRRGQYPDALNESGHATH